MTTISEPLPRKDRLCVVCENPIPSTASKYAPADGFCKSRCAREYFGTSLTVDVEGIESELAKRRRMPV